MKQKIPNLPEMTPEQSVNYLRGRLDGLSGTVRYDLSPNLRRELKDLATFTESIKIN